MNVPGRSRDPRGDRPWGPSSSPPAAARSSTTALLHPSQLPPPPATLPKNFRPAYFGPARLPIATGSGSRSPAAPSVVRPASRRAAPPRPHSVSPRGSYGGSCARPPTAPRRIEVGAYSVLEHPSAAACSAVNEALSAWRQRGCPATAPCRAGILRGGMNFCARPSRQRQRQAVSFRLPVPRIHGDSAAPSPPLHGASHPASPARTSSPSFAVDPGWTLVMSRRARREAMPCPPRHSIPARIRSTTSSQRAPSSFQNSPLRSHRPSSASSPRKSPAPPSRRCHAREHRTIDCRDPVKCDFCGRSGHRAGGCSSRRGLLRPAPPPSPARYTPTPSSAPPPPRATSTRHAPTPSSPPQCLAKLDTDMNFPGMEMIGDAASRGMDFLGAPATRPEMDHVVMATTYELDAARVDWERTAISVYLLAPPPGTDRKCVESAFRREFGLSAAQLTVSKHFPEPFLVKFDSAGLRDEVLRKERAAFKRYGLEIHCRPWRSISQAYHADLHFRVHLAVDGLPPFAWQPDIVQRVVGRRCAVQRLDDGFTTMEDTSHFGLWTWTADPHLIPKILWCTFANKAPGGLSSLIRVAEDRPDQGKMGCTFRVLLHLEVIEDFTGAPARDGGSELSAFRPSSRELPKWSLGVIDGGATGGSSSVASASIPALGRDRIDKPRAHRSQSRPRDTAHGDGRSRGSSSHPSRRGADQDRDRERAASSRSRSRHGQKCDDRQLRRHHHDDDDEGGADRDEARYKRSHYRRPASGRHQLDDRARERSPRRRSPSRGQGGRYHGGEAPPPSAPKLSSIIVAPFHFNAPTPATPVPNSGVSVDKITAQLGELMLSGLSAARTAMPAFLGVPSPVPAPRVTVTSPFGVVCRDWLAGIAATPPGFSAASSRLAAPAVSFALPAAAPVGYILAREAGGVAAVIEANPELSAWGDDSDTVLAAEHPPLDGGSGALSMREEAGKEAWDDEEEGEVARQPDAVLADSAAGKDADALVLDQVGERAAIGDLLMQDEAAAGDLLPQAVQADVPAIAAAQRAVAAFFSQPEVPLLPTPAPRAATLPLLPRRSDRLAEKPQMPAMDKCKNVLYTKMGINTQEMPLMQATKEFFRTEMPDVAVAAVGALLKLNLPSVLAADEALIAMAGAGGTELATNAVDVSA